MARLLSSVKFPRATNTRPSAALALRVVASTTLEPLVVSALSAASAELRDAAAGRWEDVWDREGWALVPGLSKRESYAVRASGKWHLTLLTGPSGCVPFAVPNGEDLFMCGLGNLLVGEPEDDELMQELDARFAHGGFPYFEGGTAWALTRRGHTMLAVAPPMLNETFKYDMQFVWDVLNSPLVYFGDSAGEEYAPIVQTALDDEAPPNRYSRMVVFVPRSCVDDVVADKGFLQETKRFIPNWLQSDDVGDGAVYQVGGTIHIGHPTVPPRMSPDEDGSRGLPLGSKLISWINQDDD